MQTADADDSVVLADDHLDSLVTVLDLVRSAPERSRPEIARLSGLGRNVVSHRVSQLVHRGLVSDGTLLSTGGRAARGLRLNADAGHILVAELGVTSISVGLSDLGGNLLGQITEPSDINDGPEPILKRVELNFEVLLRSHPVDVWGVGIGVPGPVAFSTGTLASPPTMPGWDGFDVRSYFSARFNVATWVDNEVNLMALGELRDGLARGTQDFIYVKVGSGIGAGLVSQGRLHRGEKGCAGDIGHINTSPESLIVCRCGQRGCLEAQAGGAALARQGREAAFTGESPFLASLADSGHEITAADVGRGAIHGDQRSVEIVTASARLVGDTLAGLVNFFNPSLILLGGGVTRIGDLYLATVRQMVLKRSLPLATRSLLIDRSPLSATVGMKGAAFMVVDKLLSRDHIGMWIQMPSPAGHPELASL